MASVIRSSYVSGTVVENRQWAERLHSLRIEAPASPFAAGQFVRLQLPLQGEPVARSYSLLNTPDDSLVEVLFNRVRDGKLSNALAALQAGDEVEISQPASGFFTLAEVPASRDLWMFATGTGIGPYLSMLKTKEIWQRFETLLLLHAVREADELVYADWLQSLQMARAGQFQYIPCVTRGNNPSGFERRFTALLQSGELEDFTGLAITAGDSHVMLCGNHHMLDEMKTLLQPRGLQKHLRHKPGHITTEQYF